MENIFGIKGNIVYTKSPDKFEIFENSVLIVKNGTVKGIFQTVPEKYKNIKITDYENKIIIPGFVDLHLHAPQYQNCGIGYEKTLIDWLNTYTFKEEAKFKDKEYAENVYSDFADDLCRNGIMYSVIFGTIHRESTEILMQILNNKGLNAYVGKVNMDRNSPDYLIEETEESVKETLLWIKETADKYKTVKPVITPRFVPSCTSSLLKQLGEIAVKENLPVQSHLSENLDEIEWVKELYPDSISYGEVYDRFNLLGQTKTIMAHCIHLSEDELKRLKRDNVFIAHCANSNINLTSGIAKTYKLLKEGYNVGIGSDLSGGEKSNMFANISDSVKLSKINTFTDKESRALKLSEAFYMATKGGGKFFGNAGSFDEGAEFSCLVLDDHEFWKYRSGSVLERMEKLINMGNYSNISVRYNKFGIVL